MTSLRESVIGLSEVAAMLRCHPARVYHLACRAGVQTHKLSRETVMLRSDIPKVAHELTKQRQPQQAA